MNTTIPTWKFAVAVLLATRLAFPTFVEAQSQSNPQRADQRTVTRISVGVASGPPGTAVVVPITFDPAEGMKIHRVELTLTYRSAHLRFDGLDRAPGASARGVDLSVAVPTIEGEGRQQVTHLAIVATVRFGESEASIPAGRLTSLKFYIEEEADATVYLDPAVQATEAGSYTPTSSPRVRASEGAVFVLTPGGIGAID